MNGRWKNQQSTVIDFRVSLCTADALGLVIAIEMLAQSMRSSHDTFSSVHDHR